MSKATFDHDEAVAAMKRDLLVRAMKLSYENFKEACAEVRALLAEGNELTAASAHAKMTVHFQEFYSLTSYR